MRSTIMMRSKTIHSFMMRPATTLAVVVMLALAGTSKAQTLTYSVTLADDTDDAANWEISPSTPVAAGTTVTLTYKGTKPVKEVLVKEPDPCIDEMGFVGNSTTTHGQHNNTVTGSVSGTPWEYEFWYLNGNNFFSYYSNGTFKVSWGNPNDLIAGVGYRYAEAVNPYAKEYAVDFKHQKSGNGGGYNYIGVYGKMVNPEFEFYIIDDWFNKPGSMLGTKKGQFEIDGEIYEIYHSQTPVNTYYSVRKNARSCGHISISEHFKKWDALGMKVGNLTEVMFGVIIGGGSGSYECSYYHMTDAADATVDIVKAADNKWTLVTPADNVKVAVTYMPTYSVTLATEGYGTYYNGLQDVTLPSGMKAYIVTAKTSGGETGTLTYKKIADGDGDETTVVRTVPSEVAVMLKADASGNPWNLVLNETDVDSRTFDANLLHGSDEDVTTTGGDVYYKLSYGKDQTGNGGDDLSTTLGWYYGAEGGAAFESAAHKAWLAVPSTAGSRGFFGLPGDNATAIDNGKLIIDNSQFTIDNSAGAWYSINGRKLSGRPSAKGVYVHNGIKEVVR